PIQVESGEKLFDEKGIEILPDEHDLTDDVSFNYVWHALALKHGMTAEEEPAYLTTCCKQIGRTFDNTGFKERKDLMGLIAKLTPSVLSRWREMAERVKAKKAAAEKTTAQESGWEEDIARAACE